MFRKNSDQSIVTLSRTGPPLGVFDELSWEHSLKNVRCGDFLVLYTDGVTEPQNGEGNFFGQNRLQQVLSEQVEQMRGRGLTADGIKNTLLDQLNEFVGVTPQFDDIT